MSVKETGTVLLRGGYEWSWEYSCRTTNRLLSEVVTENDPGIAETVLPTLGLDPKTRQLKANLIEVDEEGRGSKAHDRNWMNKALAMELLSTMLLTCLDDPKEVHSACVLDDNGRPKTYTQGGKGDGWAIYPTFGILLEVSSKENMDFTDFRRQMNQAIDHGGALAEEWQVPVYALVINEYRIEQEKRILEIYNEYHPIDANKGDVRPIAMWSGDFLDILDRIHPLDDDRYVQVPSRRLAAALQVAYAHLEQCVEELEVGWTANTLVKELRRRQRRLPGFRS